MLTLYFYHNSAYGLLGIYYLVGSSDFLFVDWVVCLLQSPHIFFFTNLFCAYLFSISPKGVLLFSQDFPGKLFSCLDSVQVI